MQDVFTKSSKRAIRQSLLKIPYEKMKPGESVIRYCNEVNEGSLRAAVSAANNGRHDYDFIVVKHAKDNMLEVACISKSKIEIISESEFVESSPEAKNRGLHNRKKLFNFENFEPGKSLIFHCSETNEHYLRVACSIYNKNRTNKLSVMKHRKYGVFEVFLPLECKPEFVEPSEEALRGETDET